LTFTLREHTINNEQPVWATDRGRQKELPHLKLAYSFAGPKTLSKQWVMVAQAEYQPLELAERIGQLSV
jgi:hypothetical protein